ncbi:F-actin-capping protein subunit beta [Chytriomyces hyalinus]|nr:F-actin-capping protein subunit beta [Chytriomyces hyalinus]
MVDFEQVYRDLSPWLNKSYHITNESVSHFERARVVDFKEGGFHNLDGYLSAVLEPLTPLFVSNGKNFRFALNDLDEPRMLLADKGFRGNFNNMNDVFSHNSCYREKYDEIIKDAHTSDGYHLLFGNSSARMQHGIFQTPATFAVINGNVPIFSQAKLDCYSDIVIPLNLHIGNAVNSVADTVAWEKKLPVLFWRGSTTGGVFNSDTPWKSYGRTRLIEWGKQWGAKYPNTIFDAAHESPNLENSLNVDVGFSGFTQGDDKTFDLINATYGFKGRVSFEKTKEFKYLLVLDGNTWPSRLQSYLQTNSVILYNGIFTDYFNWKLVPWVHYVPVKLNFSDLEERIQWLTDHDAEAKQIAINAQTLLKKWSTLKQVQCYTGFALLEYSSLFEAALEIV